MTITSRCAGCGIQMELSSDMDAYRCPRCTKEFVFRRCVHCGGIGECPTSIRKGTTFGCPYCGRTNSVPAFGREKRATAAKFAEYFRRFGLGVDDPDRRMQTGLVLVAGHGHPIAAGEVCYLVCAKDRLAVVPENQRLDPVSYSYDEVVSFEVGGPGVVQRGGGFIGGGAGVVGAAEGMLMAGALNALTTRTDVITVVQLTTYSGSFVFRHSKDTPQQVAHRLIPIESHLARSRAAMSQQATGGNCRRPG